MSLGKTQYAVVSKGTTMSFSKESASDWLNNILQPFGKSADMWASINNSIEFVNNNLDADITFIGHSKGGAEAAANAVANNKNAILFNPEVNPKV